MFSFKRYTQLDFLRDEIAVVKALIAEKLAARAERSAVIEARKELDDLERQKITTYDLTISGAFGLDQKLTAVDIIKTLHQTIADLRFYVELPNREAKRGVEAQEELSKLREADHG
mgnify:CR=1 FL=1